MKKLVYGKAGFDEAVRSLYDRPAFPPEAEASARDIIAGIRKRGDYNMCWLVAGLYLFSAVVQFIGLALVYNLDKKTLATMNEELAARHENVAE